ncbi:MAG: response regulator [Candidatus Taylorbacteria bacterium]
MNTIRILVVDEEPPITQLIKLLISKTMSNSELEISECHSVSKANQIMGQNGPIDIVITDHEFRHSNGTEIVETAKVACATTKIIMYSSTLDHHIINKCGADKYMQKPFYIEELITAIRQLTPTHKLGLDPQACSNC